jgi:rhamnosyltransferase subunit B
MHAVLISIGTDGDIFPYVGLGAALQSRGHTVTVCVSEHYEALAQRHGLGFRPLVSIQENNDLFEHPDFWNPLKTAPLAARWGVRFIRRQYDLISGLMTPETVLVANPGVFAAGIVHEKSRVPWASLILQPGTIPSSIAPPRMPMFDFLARAPRPVWKVFWRALDAVGDMLAGPELNRVRADLGLKPMQRMFQNWLSKQLAIGMFPNWYGPPQADWPSQIRLVGFPQFDGGLMDTLAPEVLDFCRAGKPPVLFTFGTGMAHSADLFQVALEACAILGARGLFLTKYRNQLPDVLPPDMLHCSFAPFQKLFPLCSAVMHHGGVGTVAKAMAAGIPQLIYPLCFDQRDNGVRAKRLGGGDCLPAGGSSAKQVATALTALLTEESRTESRKLIKRFEKNDALAKSAELLEKLAAERGTSSV